MKPHIKQCHASCASLYEAFNPINVLELEGIIYIMGSVLVNTSTFNIRSNEIYCSGSSMRQCDSMPVPERMTMFAFTYAESSSGF